MPSPFGSLLFSISSISCMLISHMLIAAVWFHNIWFEFIFVFLFFGCFWKTICFWNLGEMFMVEMGEMFMSLCSWVKGWKVLVFLHFLKVGNSQGKCAFSLYKPIICDRKFEKELEFFRHTNSSLSDGCLLLTICNKVFKQTICDFSYTLTLAYQPHIYLNTEPLQFLNFFAAFILDSNRYFLSQFYYSYFFRQLQHFHFSDLLLGGRKRKEK